MEWIPITEQPLPKDGKNIVVTIESKLSSYIDVIHFCDQSKQWYYYYPDYVHQKISNNILDRIAAWMYLPAPYEG